VGQTWKEAGALAQNRNGWRCFVEALWSWRSERKQVWTCMVQWRCSFPRMGKVHHASITSEPGWVSEKDLCLPGIEPNSH
jgi:hypothetical protein